MLSINILAGTLTHYLIWGYKSQKPHMAYHLRDQIGRVTIYLNLRIYFCQTTQRAAGEEIMML